MFKKGTRVILKDGRSALIQRRYSDANILIAFADGNTSTIVRSEIADVVRCMCEVCKVAEALPSERYCKECRTAKLAELKETGYLQIAPSRPFGRNAHGGEKKENTNETKHGVDDFRIMPDPRSDF